MDFKNVDVLSEVEEMFCSFLEKTNIIFMKWNESVSEGYKRRKKEKKKHYLVCLAFACDGLTLWQMCCLYLQIHIYSNVVCMIENGTVKFMVTLTLFSHILLFFLESKFNGQNIFLLLKYSLRKLNQMFILKLLNDRQTLQKLQTLSTYLALLCKKVLHWIIADMKSNGEVIVLNGQLNRPDLHTWKWLYFRLFPRRPVSKCKVYNI